MMTPLKYGFPARQIAFALVLTVLLGVGNVALIVCTPDGPAGLISVIAASGFYLWLLIRHTSGYAKASIEADALMIEPTRFPICGVRRPLRIGWDQLESANEINFSNGQRPFLMLRWFARPKLIVVSVRPGADPGFLSDVTEQAMAWRSANPEVPPLRQDDFFAGPLWKIFGAFLVGAFGCSVVAIFYFDRAAEWGTWLRLLAISGLLLPMVRRIFRPPGIPL